MMKYITLAVMLISLVAVGALAQSEDDPVKEQTQTQTKEQLKVQTKEQLKEQTQLQTKEQTQLQLKEQTQLQTKEQAQLQTRENGQVLDGDKSGGQNQQMNYGGGEGETNQLGENSRRGDEFVGQGGPQGPMGSGPLDDFIKMASDDIDGAFAGEMHQYGWGPGDSTLDGPFGPNDGTGFGPGGRNAAEGGNSDNGARSQARSGRR